LTTNMCATIIEKKVVLHLLCH